MREKHKMNISIKFDSEIMSSLPLQMIVYFSILFFPIWYLTLLFVYFSKNDEMANFYQYITIPVITCIPFVEVCRLYMAFEGNIKEKIPELGGSWLLTLLIQVPLLVYLLLIPGNKQIPLESSVLSFYAVFQALHLIEAFRTIKRIARHQAQKYYINESSDTN